MTYRGYVRNFDLLWDTFSKEAVANGSLDDLLKEINPELEQLAIA